MSENSLPGMSDISAGFSHLSPSDKDEYLAARAILCRIGDKWSVYVVHSLRNRPLRFSEIKRSIDGISQRMLTLTLHSLERDGLITRTVYSSKPPRVDYELTKVGQTLVDPVLTLLAWVERHRAYIHYSRQNFDQQSS